MEHVLILGGDGYLGWPTAMHLSKQGYAVTVVDNYMRRSLSRDINCDALYENPNLIERCRIWHDLTGLEIRVQIGDLTDPGVMENAVSIAPTYAWQATEDQFNKPSSVIHYAEQPSAPYSLLHIHAANLTLNNNLIVTNNIMWAMRNYVPDAHLIKLGTMGEYGTPDIDIEEGWLDIEHKGRRDKFLFPRQASSIYHTSKIMDTDLLWFGVRTWGLTVTDLMQGPVYGLVTPEIDIDSRLRTIFNYDEVFGTVVNRFVTQAVVGYPLTVYGGGGQTRGYLNLNDTLQCVAASIKTPAQAGELRIFNQITETFSVRELAERCQRVGRSRGLDVKVKSIENPRVEKEEHYYNPTYQGLRDIGVTPTYLTDDILNEIFEVVEEYKHNVNESAIYRGVTWRR